MDQDNELDFLEQEIANVGANSASKVIANRSAAVASQNSRPVKAPPAQTNTNDAGLDDLADLEDLMEGGEPTNQQATAKEFLAEAFCMVFKDEYTQFSSAMHHAFDNTIQSTIETRKFIQSTDERALFLKNEILYAARLAMHLSLDKAVMGDFELETG